MHVPGSRRLSPGYLKAHIRWWWSHALFARPDDLPRAQRVPAALWLLLFAGAALLFFTRLSAPLQEPQESRYAEIPRQMLAEGRWVVPVLHGQPYLDKPPLLYWLIMACYATFGVHDWAARLVPCGASFLTA